MQVALKLKGWQIKENTETKLPEVCGTFGLLMGDKEIASQEFNQGYSGKKIAFSNELTQKIQFLETEIKAEMERLLQ